MLLQFGEIGKEDPILREKDMQRIADYMDLNSIDMSLIKNVKFLNIVNTVKNHGVRIKCKDQRTKQKIDQAPSKN
jgi:hypothetical protein